MVLNYRGNKVNIEKQGITVSNNSVEFFRYFFSKGSTQLSQEIVDIDGISATVLTKRLINDKVYSLVTRHPLTINTSLKDVLQKQIEEELSEMPVNCNEGDGF